MTNEEQKRAIEKYIAAYNSFDIDGMLALVHPKVTFKNVSGSEVNAEAEGIEQFRELAEQAKALFLSRHQQASNFKFVDNTVSVDIAYEGILAADLPNGMKAGETLQLTGRSEFEFESHTISRITDFS